MTAPSLRSLARRIALPALLLGLALTLIAARVPGEAVVVRPDVMGCEAGCRVVAGGWPVPWIADDPSLSPVNSVSLISAALGIDDVRPAALAFSAAFWVAVALMALGAALRVFVSRP